MNAKTNSGGNNRGDLPPLHSVQAQLTEIHTDIRQTQALLASLIDSALDAILVLDERHRILLFNPAAEEMFDVNAEEVIGKALERFVPPGLIEWHRNQMENIHLPNRARYRMGAAHETEAIRSDGIPFPVEITVSGFSLDEKKYITAIVRDISSRKKIEEELRHLSTHDALTGLYNRFFFEEELDRLERGRPPYPVTIMIADVDGLKNVNDRFGHLSGDDLIKSVAAILKSSFRTEDIVARLGGDEFGIILQNSNQRITESTVQRIYDRLWQLNRHSCDLQVDISIGVATYQQGESLDETIRRADRAMYRHKNDKGQKRRL